MSEYEYQDPQFVDITDEFLAAPVASELRLAPNFNLEEAVSSVDLMHPRMDRGTVLVDGIPLPLYRRHMLDAVLPTCALAAPRPPPTVLLALGNRLEALVAAWMGGASAADTLCTCLVLHRPDALASPTAGWLVRTTLRACLLLADVMAQANVARNDEFMPALYSLVDGRRDPLGHTAVQWWNTHQAAVRNEHGGRVWRLCRRARDWMLFLSLLQTADLDYGQLMEHLRGVASTLHEDDADADADADGGDVMLSAEEMLIEPKLANLFTAGCVRRAIPLLTAAEGRSRWRTLVGNLMEMTVLVSRMPPFHRLLHALLGASAEPHPLAAVQRSLTFAMLLRGETTMFGCVAPGRYAMESLLLPQPDRLCERLLVDALQIACHAPARQRRLIPKLIRAILEQRPVLPAASMMRIACYLGAWFVILGFHLGLYEAYEVPEAHLWISVLAEGPAVRAFALRELARTKARAGRTLSSIYDPNRRAHRWQCLQALLAPALDMDRVLLFNDGGSGSGGGDGDGDGNDMNHGDGDDYMQTIYKEYKRLLPPIK